MALNMKQYLELLKELSQLDSRLQLEERELQAIPSQLENSGAEYLLLSRTLKEKETKLEAMTKERLALEEESKILSEEVLEKEKKLYALKTQKEYQATLKEIAKIKQDNKTRENRVLSLLEQGEKIVAEITQLKSQTADKEGDFKKVEGDLNLRKETLSQELVAFKERRPQILESLPAEILKRYDSVKRRFSNPIAAVRRGVCQGCNMNIPPQVYNEMLKIDDLRHCPHCHRLIYAEMENKMEDKTENKIGGNV